MSPRQPSIEAGDSGAAPAISIVIPSLNEAAELPKLLAQLTPELKRRHRLEVIVSDGGSGDGTTGIAARGADLVVAAPPGTNQTIAGGRNAGAARARGGILLFLNADVTIVEPERFFRDLSEHFSGRAGQAVAAAGCDVSVDPGLETRFDALFHVCFNAWCRFLNATGVGMGRGECQAVRAGAFRSAGGYDERLAAAEDFDLFRRLRRYGAVGYLREGRVNESPRRYRKLGYMRVVGSWTANALAVFFTGKAAARSWRPVR